MMALAILLGLVAVGLYAWGISKLVAEKKKASWVLAGATAVLLFLFVPTITDIVNDTGTRAAEDTEQTTDTGGIPSIGETEHNTSLGDLTLLKEVYPDDVVDLTDIGVTVNAIKVFRVENPEVSFKADIERYKGEALGDTLYYMTVNFTAGNLTEDSVEWGGLNSIMLDDGTLFTQADDDMLLGKDSDGNLIDTLYDGVGVQEYTQMYVLDNPDIDSLDLEFAQPINLSNYEVSPAETTVNYQFD